MSETKPKKKKFKYTRELVRIAIDEGMTQVEIANLCRVQQSKVSAWFRGESKALEHEIAELKKRFSHRLNRTTARVYLVAKKDESPARWEESEHGMQLLKLQKELQDVRQHLERLSHLATSKSRHAKYRTALDTDEAEQNLEPEVLEEKARLEERRAALEKAEEELQTKILHGDLNRLSLEGLIRLDQEDFAAARQREQVAQVEGPIVLRYTFTQPELVERGRIKELKRLPVARWLVHRQPDGRFVLIIQARRTIVGSNRWRWWNALRIANETPEKRRHRSGSEEYDFRQWEEKVYLECADDAARWVSYIEGPMSSMSLLSHCDSYFSDPQKFHSPHDELALPFLLRKMIVEQGDDLPELVRITALE